MNAFFISCEMLRKPELRGVPAAVAGDPKTRSGIILAANYEARAFGVRTAMVLHKALELCPGMHTVPPDHDFYEQKSQEVMQLLSGYTPVVEQNSIDEAWLDMTGCEGLSGPPVEAAKRIMADIRDHLGLSCSIGIAGNKFLAKMASEMKKPMGITELWPDDVQVKMWPLPVRAMYGIGAKTSDRLSGFGIQTIGDLARTDRKFLVQTFGKGGEDLHDHANGIDRTEVCARLQDEMKSIGRSTTLPEDAVELAKARLVLMELADDIGRTARRHGKKGQTVQITLKYADFQVCTRQATVPSTSTTQAIYQAGIRLLEQNWDSSRPIRLIGISLSGFDGYDPPVQLTLFDEPGCMKKDDKRKELIDQAMDRIRGRHGDNAVGLASLLKKKQKDPPDGGHNP